MKHTSWVSALLLCGALSLPFGTLMAQEHPEHPEHPEKTTPAEKASLTTDQLAAAITAFVASDAQMKGGYFLVYDAVAKKALALTLDRVHQERLSSLGNGLYFACADFKSTDGTTYDVDVFMKESDDGLEASEVHVHKVNGEPRYAWKEEGGVWMREDLK